MMSSLTGLIKGLHHITLVTSNQEVNRRFYTEVLGLRRVKLSVNQDDIYHRHMFYANESATTGSAITFFEWPHLPHGSIGLSSPHHLAYSVRKIEDIPKWKAWLSANNVRVAGPFLRNGRVSLYLKDPDGVIVEIVALATEDIKLDYVKQINDESPSVSRIAEDMRLTVFDHATPVSADHELTEKFLEKFLGLKVSYKRRNPDDQNESILGVGNDERADFLLYLVYPDAPDGSVGAGNVHHVAVAVEDETDQRRIMQRLNAAGVQNSGIINRFWFKSLYFRDPDGNLLEVATRGPGYTADEPLDKLGSSLVLPPWLEPDRSRIETKLAERDNQNPARWPPVYRAPPLPPENLRTLTTESQQRLGDDISHGR